MDSMLKSDGFADVLEKVLEAPAMKQVVEGFATGAGPKSPDELMPAVTEAVCDLFKLDSAECAHVGKQASEKLWWLGLGGGAEGGQPSGWRLGALAVAVPAVPPILLTLLWRVLSRLLAYVWRRRREWGWIASCVAFVALFPAAIVVFFCKLAGTVVGGLWSWVRPARSKRD